MHIAGMGVIFNQGRGLKRFEEALTGEAIPSKGYPVPIEALKDKWLLKDSRRADGLSRMATLAAYDAFIDSGLDDGIKDNLGIILVTAFGPHVTTFKFLDDILTFGDTGVSPTLFSHSVHNAATSYIASALGSRGPTLTLTQFENSFYQGIILAESWLNEGRCDYVLLGSADQIGEVMRYIVSQKLKLAEDGRIEPFSFDKNPGCSPGEGSAFFLLTNKENHNKYCRISVVNPTDRKEKYDLLVLDSDGMSKDESIYLSGVEKDQLVSSYAQIFGSMLTLSSFSCMAASLMLSKQVAYLASYCNNPHGLMIAKEERVKKINKVGCLRYNCSGKRLEIKLYK
jgi:3-oxoacyl-[acyl-carrier-protein] synthase II